MARFGKTEIALSDTISALVTGVNTIADDLGNVDNLATGDSNVVSSINAVRNVALSFSDSASVINTIRNNFTNVGDVTIRGTVTGLTSLTTNGIIVDSASGITSIKADTTNGLTIDSATIGQLSGDSANFTTLTADNLTANSFTTGSAGLGSGTLTLDGVTVGHLKPFRVKNSSGTNILAGYLLSTSNTNGTL